MRGYQTDKGYMGYVLGKGYQLFKDEDAYYEWEYKSIFATYEEHLTSTPGY